MPIRKLPISRRLALLALALAPCVAAAAPVSAAQSSLFTMKLSGEIGITSADEGGNPATAAYEGTGAGTQLGATRMEGDITVVGWADCPGGFLATHNDTLMASNGDEVYLTISEKSCPSAPGTYSCKGTYTVTGGTGRYAKATGRGDWSGSVTFGPDGRGTFSTTHSGELSGV